MDIKGLDERNAKALATVKAALQRATRRDDVYVTVMTQELYGAFDALEAAQQPREDRGQLNDIVTSWGAQHKMRLDAKEINSLVDVLVTGANQRAKKPGESPT